jgi:hypothetical protein
MNYKLFISDDGNVGIGTGTPGYKLDVVGIIRACEVLIGDPGWCDYVFDKDYTLMPLDELRPYVLINKHLPGIPTTEEIDANGLKLGQMQTLQMGKIEELYLYLFQIKDELDELKKENKELKKLQ